MNVEITTFAMRILHAPIHLEVTFVSATMGSLEMEQIVRVSLYNEKEKIVGNYEFHAYFHIFLLDKFDLRDDKKKRA